MRQLHVFFLPFMAQGHMIPVVDMAKLLSVRGVRTTIVTTPLNAKLISTNIQKTAIDLQILNFPCAEAGLPEGYEIADAFNAPNLISPFFRATAMLQQPLEKLMEELRPDYLVADMFFPWANDAASKIGIPRLHFHGTSIFSLCASHCVRLYQPHKKVSSFSEQFILPSLPHDIKLTANQLEDYIRNGEETEWTELMRKISESENGSFGFIMNTFYELEPEYADYYRNVLGRRAWPIGPLSLCNEEVGEKAQRGKVAAIKEEELLNWLDSKKPNSVVYVGFGSMVNFTTSQLKEMAMGLEASEQPFIWVVRKGSEEEEEWLPEGFEDRTKGKGLIIKGWAPQVLILDHSSVGGFVTHCGWNSTLEAVSAGVPMVTWPIFAEQFYNEKMVTQVLKMGVEVGVQKWSNVASDIVKKEALEKAIKTLMAGEEAEEMRSRSRAMAEKARRAVSANGSSSSNLNDLIKCLKNSSGFGRSVISSNKKPNQARPISRPTRPISSPARV